MVIIYLSIIALYIFIFLLSAKEQIPVNADGGKDRIFCARMAAYMYRKFGNNKLFHYTNIKQNLYLLNPGTEGKREKEETALRKFNLKRIGLVLLLVFIGDLFAICLFISSRMEGQLSDGRYIYRNVYGDGSIEADLQAEIRSGSEKNSENFKLTIAEQIFKEDIVSELAEELKNNLPYMILGENKSGEEIRSDLDLMDGIEEYPFHISWESSNYALLYYDGSVTNEEVQEKGEVVELTAILTYGDYTEEYIFPIRILPPVYSIDELFRKKIYELLVSIEKENRYKDKMTLPDQVDGASLIWKEKKEDSSGYILILMCICAGAVYLLREKELKSCAEQRNRQMLSDYPQLVSKLTLYMGAGMTVRNAFKKIALDYRNEKKNGGKYRYVYEEMLLACYELDSGISETSAYEQFGKRCRLAQYTKFTSLLIQNLKKGSGSISEALRHESKNALEERRNMARKLGEEAGTKLLLPMMLMLGIVMVLIIIPAYFSFGV